PFYNIPFYLVPGTKYFRAPDSVFFVGTLGIAVLAARGVERALAAQVSKKYVAAWVIFAAAMALLAVTGVLSAIARSVAPESRLDAVDDNAGALIIGAFRSLVFVVVTGLLLLKMSDIRERAGRLVPIVALAVLAALDLFIVNKQYWVFSPPASVLYASDAARDYLRKLPEPARVLPLEIQNGGDIALYSGAELMTHRILNPIGYHGNELARYNTLLAIPQGGGPGDESIRLILTTANIRRLTATQYVIANGHELASVIPGVVQVAGPSTEDASGRSNYVYKLPGTAPFAWVAPVIVKAADDAVISTIMNPRFDVQGAALFDPGAPVTAAPNVTTLPQPTGIVAHFDSYGPGRMSLSLDHPAPAGSALIVAENYYPGWHAIVDGKAAAIGRAQYSMIGVQLPAGAHRIDLSFTSAPYETGKTVTWIAILIGVLALAGGVIMERRRIA
ncbi:MAG: YfhO family protein, partial [Gemmatimonadaceae bacterium]